MRMALETDLEEQRPQKQTLCQTLRRDAHAKCLILTLLIAGCLAAITWCRLAEVTRLVVNFQSFPITTRRRVSPCDEGYVYIPVAFMAMLYVVYLVECWHCSTRLELTYKVDASAVYEHVRCMREAQPLIWWKAVCYHYTRRSRQVTRYRNGDAYTTTQTFYERVNSHAAGSCFVYGCCGVKDISRKLKGLERFAATRIRFSKGFAFANLEAANEFEEQRARFFHHHERLDDYMEMREGLDLVGVNFQEYMVAFADRLPWYVSHQVFWFCSLLMLSWPLRIAIECNTAYVHYQVTKLFGVNYLSPTSGYAGRMSRGSTTDSVEMERHISNNFTLAPSYSEALLMTTPTRICQIDSNGNFGLCSDELDASETGPTIPTGSGRRGSVWRWAARFSWRRTRRGSQQQQHHARGGIPVSLSRMSLENGHVVYVVSPLQSQTHVRPTLRRTYTCPHAAVQQSDDNLPTYEALFPSLRRSVTERDFHTRLLPARGQTFSCSDFQTNEETSL